jgi:hypothetical protein
MSISFIRVAACAAFVCSACSAVPEDKNGGGTYVSSTKIQAAVGGRATSSDRRFTVGVGPNSFDQDVSIRISLTNQTPDRERTRSPAYAISVSPETAQTGPGFSADIVFSLNAADYQSKGGAALAVAHGEQPGDAWDELLTASYNSSLEELRAVTTGFSYFMLIDVDGNTCSCDTTAACEDCSCDPDCVSGCSSHSQCDSECCYEGICSPASYCGSACSCNAYPEYCDPDCSCDPDCQTEGCSYNEQCETNCCYGGICSPASYCSSSCTCNAYPEYCDPECSCDPDCDVTPICSTNDQCDTGCCYSGVCSPATYCGTTSWTCDPTWNGTGDGCDCGCGTMDPDCTSGGCTTPGCTAAGCGFCWDANGANLCPQQP